MNIEQKHAVEGCLINREAMLRKLDAHLETNVTDDEEVRDDLEIRRYLLHRLICAIGLCESYKLLCP